MGEYWAWRREWIAGMTRGQRIRHRIFQAAVVLSIVIIAGWAALSAWIRMPDLPDFGQGEPSGSQGSGFEGAENPDVTISGRKKGVYTFLVVGRDTAGGGNTDTMILVSYDTVNKTISGMSLPRDTMVNVSTNNRKLNAIYNYNKGKDKATQVEKGMTALKTQVKKLTGITPDFYVMVDWEAVGELVDAIGGVWFDVPFDMDYDDPTPGQDLHIHQKKGYRLLTGDDAMQVIRHRKNNDGSHSGGDVGRLKIQQDFLMAAAQQCLKPEILLKAPALAKIFLENVTTDLSVGNLLAFAQKAMGIDAENAVSFFTMPYTGYDRGGSYVLAVEDEMLVLINEKLNPYLRDIQSADLELMYKKSNGGLGVTNGTLAKSSLGDAPAPKPSKPVTPEEPEEPEIPVEPEEPETPATPPSGSQTPPDPGTTVPGGSQTTPDPGTTAPGGSHTAPDPGTNAPGGSAGGTEGPSDPASTPTTPVDPASTPGGQGEEGGAAGQGNTMAQNDDTQGMIPLLPAMEQAA